MSIYRNWNIMLEKRKLLESTAISEVKRLPEYSLLSVIGCQ